MTSIGGILTRVSKWVTPSSSEEAHLVATSRVILEKVERAASRFPEVRGVHLGGSFAKGTWLPGDVDLDIFVRLARDTDDSRFEKVGLAIGEQAVRGYPHGKKYAQHPYTEAKVEGTKVNVVPCYDVEPGKWKSAADRSLYHVGFVNEAMNGDDKLQVRLLKRFMKVVGVYGAEIENEGFSGYASEVLVHRNGGFEQTLRYFAGLRIAEKAPFSLRDPVDSERELGTAVSGQTLAKMVLASRAFLKSPDSAYFKGIKTQVRRQLIGRLYCIVFEHPPLSEDTLWGELKRSTRQFVKQVEAEGFKVVRAAPASNNDTRSAIILLPESDELPETVQRAGPSVHLAEEVKKFLAKNRNKVELVWVAEDARLHVLQRRQFTELRDLLESLCDERIRHMGVSRDVAASIERTGRVLSGAEVGREGSSERWFREGVESIVSDSFGTHRGK